MQHGNWPLFTVPFNYVRAGVCTVILSIAHIWEHSLFKKQKLGECGCKKSYVGLWYPYIDRLLVNTCSLHYRALAQIFNSRQL